jgi:uncharacterized protein YoxC
MVLLTILSGIALLALLIILGWSLAQIAHSLDGIRRNLQNIAMGVRAIERETAPLPEGLSSLNGNMEALDSSFDSNIAGLTRLES